MVMHQMAYSHNASGYIQAHRIPHSMVPLIIFVVKRLDSNGQNTCKLFLLSKAFFVFVKSMYDSFQIIS